MIINILNCPKCNNRPDIKVNYNKAAAEIGYYEILFNVSCECCGYGIKTWLKSVNGAIGCRNSGCVKDYNRKRR